MKKYLIQYEIVINEECVVEAESEKEAYRIFFKIHPHANITVSRRYKTVE